MSTAFTPSPAAPGASSWSPFWIELPFLAACAVLCVVAVVALYRARPEDIPRLFAAFGAALARLGRRAGAEVPPAIAEQEDGPPMQTEPEPLPAPRRPSAGADRD